MLREEARWQTLSKSRRSRRNVRRISHVCFCSIGGWLLGHIALAVQRLSTERDVLVVRGSCKSIDCEKKFVRDDDKMMPVRIGLLSAGNLSGQ
jgi:hypothetical protein